MEIRTMVRQCLLLIGTAFSTLSVGQIANYVINPSFEKVITTATTSPTGGMYGWSAIDTTQGAFVPYTIGPPWNNAPYSSYGFQNPRSGLKMLGSMFFLSTMGPPNRWYPRNRLRDKLTSGKTYCGRYYVVNTNNTTVGIDAYGLLAADTTIDTISVCTVSLPYLLPQIINSSGIIVDTMSWVPISGTFVATGNEKYAVLGNFKTDAATQTIIINPTYLPTLVTDLYIDDVSLVDLDLPAFAGRDTNIAFGDSIYLGRELDVGLDYACQWFKLPNDTVPIDTAAGIWAKPSIKTSYVVRQQLWCSGVKYDTVTVHFNLTIIEEPMIEDFYISPNPSSGEIVIKLSRRQEQIVVTITNITGQTLYKSIVNLADGNLDLSVNYPDGLYFVTLTSPKGPSTKKFVIKS